MPISIVSVGYFAPSCMLKAKDGKPHSIGVRREMNKFYNEEQFILNVEMV